MLFKDCGRTDGQTDDDDERWVITVTHLEPLAQMSQKSDKNKLTVLLMPQVHLQTIKKEPVKFQSDQYKTVGGVALTRYLPSVAKCLSKEGNNSARRIPRKNETRGPMVLSRTPGC